MPAPERKQRKRAAKGEREKKSNDKKNKMKERMK